MSITTIHEIVLTIIQVLILVPVIYTLIKIIGAGENGLLPVFFAFAMLSYFLSDIYFVVYEYLRPDTRMPFASDEVSEAAMFLLLCAGLEMLPGEKRKLNPFALIFSLVFIGSNIALWIVWSGEWVQDILFGLPYIYFMYLLIKGILSSNALNKNEWIIAGCLSILTVISQVVMYYPGVSNQTLADIISYAFMYSISIWLLIKTINAIRKCDRTGKSVYLSLTTFLATFLDMYASLDGFFIFAILLNTIIIPVMLVSLKKELGINDLR